MEIAELIRARRSMGAFTRETVAPGLIESLLETAVYAPNHRLTEPWRFIFITGAGRERYAEIRSRMVLEGMNGADEAARQQAAEGTFNKFAHIPFFLLVVQKRSPNPEIEMEDYAACCCVVQNFLLLAEARGLGTVWKTFKNHPMLREFVGVAADERVVAIVHLGYPAEAPPVTERQSAGERVTVIEA